MFSSVCFSSPKILLLSLLLYEIEETGNSEFAIVENASEWGWVWFVRHLFRAIAAFISTCLVRASSNGAEEEQKKKGIETKKRGTNERAILERRLFDVFWIISLFRRVSRIAEFCAIFRKMSSRLQRGKVKNIPAKMEEYKI